MIVLGIDPSRSATGLAFVKMPERHLTYSICLRPDKKLSTVEQEQWIGCEACRTYYHSLDPFAGCHQWDVDIIGIEWPPERHRGLPYTRKDGTKGSRAVVSASQWRLIGRLQAVLPHPQVLVTPQEVKLAAGLSAREKRKPVEEIEALLGVELEGYKYEREAIADACAVALAAYAKYEG